MLLASVLQTMPALCQSLFSLLPATGHLADGFKPTEQCPAYSTNSCNISPPSSPSKGRCGLHNSQRPLPERWAGANSSSDSALQSVFTRQSSRPNALPLHVLSQRGSLSVILTVRMTFSCAPARENAWSLVLTYFLFNAFVRRGTNWLPPALEGQIRTCKAVSWESLTLMRKGRSVLDYIPRLRDA